MNIYEFRNSYILDWLKLKAISRSAIGKFAFVAPVLPFVISFLGVIDWALEVPSDFFNTDQWQRWVESNQNYLAGLYIGLFLFVVGKYLFEFLCPFELKRYDDPDHFLVEALKKMVLAKNAGDKEVYEHLKLSISENNKKREELAISRGSIRYVITILFYLAILLLIVPIFGKFISVLWGAIFGF